VIESPKDILDLVQPHLRSAPPYTPVTPPDVLAERQGLPLERILKLDANENPYGPSPKALEALARTRSYHIYPDPEQGRLRAVLAGYVGYEPEWIVPGAGSDELIELACRLFVPPGEAIVNFPPTFGMYRFLADTLGQKTIEVRRRPGYTLDVEGAREAAARARLIFAVSPNNPTGTPLSRAELDTLLDTGLPVVVDEAYAEFAGESYAELVRERPNLLIIRTLSKWAGLAGLRAGFMVAQPALVEIAMRVKQPYSVSVAAEVAALASFDDLPLLQERVRAIVAERDRLAGLLGKLPGVAVVPSKGNFLLCELTGVPAREVYRRLFERGIMLRYFDTPLLQNHLRISVGRPEQTDGLVSALREVMQALRKEGSHASR
jgi:histidinol-phosphate aminotransferase